MRAYIFDGSVAEVVEVLEAFERLKAEYSDQVASTTIATNPTATKSNSSPKKLLKSNSAGGNVKTKPESKSKLKTRRKPLLLGTKPKEKFVSVEVIKEVFERRPITGSMAELLKNLLSTKEGIWVPTSKLCQMLKYSPRQLQGLLVALRRRVAHTDGYKEDHHFLDSQLDNKTGEYNFRIPKHLRPTIKQIMKV